MSDDAGKTEKPTPKKLREARREGQIPRTQDAATWVGLAAGFALLPKTASITKERFTALLGQLDQVAADPTPGRALAVLSDAPMAILTSAAPVCLAAAAGALLATVAQGVYPSGKALKPKFKKLNPKQGVKRMFGVQAAWEAAKAVLKVAVISTVVLIMAKGLVPALLGGPQGLPLAVLIERTADGLDKVIWAAVLAGVLLALADYAFQRRRVMKQLRMSHKDIRDEHKQSEGDPMMKGAMRSRMMAMSRNRMLAAVAEADVVLVNPTHVAVALKYRAGLGAPRVVAKGAGAVAAKIRERAREARVPLVEDKPLARALYRICEVNDEIPSELYMAVARILAFVMAAGKPSRTASPQRPPANIVAELPDQLPSKPELARRRSAELRAARAGSAGS